MSGGISPLSPCDFLASRGTALLYLSGGGRFEIEKHLALFQLIFSYRVSKAFEVVMTNADFQWTVARGMYI
jgi:hypothetical protein